MDKVKVFERAVMQRLNRALKADGQIVKRNKAGSRSGAEFGRFYVISRTSVVAKNIDLSAQARAIGVMLDDEVVGEFETFGECLQALSDSLLRVSSGTMPCVDLKDVTRDANEFNRKMRGTVKAVHAKANVMIAGVEVLSAV